MTSYSIRCIREPRCLPITLESAKDFLKITNTKEDELIITLIKSATKIFEGYTGRALIFQDWQVSCKQFAKQSTTLPIRPAVEILKVELVNYYHQSVLFQPKHYILEPNSSELFFKVIPFANNVKIEYVAGYGDTPDSVPFEIQTALLSHVAFMYDNREAVHLFDLRMYDQFKNMRI
jgi:uncharacterized phiE125 gp8 family phage protein